ncbi:MAG TPA: chromosomal replication initiator protein DnaA [Candidatus Moranbacteria bacterium]|nr:chromosomal replication initiator protein DnaA [Candidatus Moranbacteria bacterium]
MTKEELWRIVLGEMELSMSKANFTTWFKNTFIVSLEENNLVIAVPNIFAKEWLEKKYRKNILESVQKNFPKINTFSCIIETERDTTIKSNQETGTNQSIDSLVKKNHPQTQNETVNLKKISNHAPHFSTPQRRVFSSNLNPRYNFNNFVVGTNNELAFAACQAIARDPGKVYNPLFIYGGVGLGKTHLIQSTGNQILANNPNAAIRYLSMERFANELVDAIQNKKAKEFKNNYIALDILILDDVQFLAGREKTQHEFFHVFDALYQAGKQLIITSDRPPKSIPTIEDRLRSRFEGGMMADVSNPDLETRIAIIQKKLLEKNFELNREIIEYLAENIYHNVRELEGALNKIIVTAQLRNKLPSLREVVDLTKDITSQNQRKDLSAEKIIQSVAQYYNIEPKDICGTSRKRKVIRPRQVAVYLLRKDINLSYPEIGEILGGRDHSTAIYAFDKMETELKDNQELNNQLKFIREKFVDY